MPKLSTAEQIEEQFEDIKAKLFDKINELTPLIAEKVLEKVADKQSISDHKFDTLISANNALREVNARLLDRISSLEKIIKKQSPDEPPSLQVYSPPSYVDSAPSIPQPGKKTYSFLILSDSIYRHVGGECPIIKSTAPTTDPAGGKRTRRPPQPPIIQEIELLEGLKGLKVVVPGAQCPRLMSEAARVNQHCTFDHVIVHVGTNYAYSELTNYDIADEIEQFLAGIQELFDCKVTFSEILPRILGDDYDQLVTFNHIGFLNKLVANACDQLKIARLHHERFSWNRFGRFNRRLLARDGCHLSHAGVETIQDEVKEHLVIFDKNVLWV